MKIIKNFFINIPTLNNINWITGSLFMLTNFIYFIPIILFGPDEFTIPIMIIGLISILYHIFQIIKHTNHICAHFCMWLDIIVASAITIYIIILKIKQIPFWWWIILAISIILWIIAVIFKNHYWWIHGLWHILTGFLLLVAVAPDNEKWSWTKPIK